MANVINMQKWVKENLSDDKKVKNLKHATEILKHHLIVEHEVAKIQPDSTYSSYLEEYSRLLGVGE